MGFSRVRVSHTKPTEAQKTLMAERTKKIIDKHAPMDNFCNLINAQLTKMGADDDLFIVNIPGKNRIPANWRYFGCVPYTYAVALEAAGLCKAKWLRPDVKPEHIK